MMKKLITVIIPVYNESECLPILYERLKSVLTGLPDYDREILFINDGSTDGSLEIIKDLRKKDKSVSYVNLARNYGKETAMAAGFDYANGDAAIIMDADLQDPPELICEMVKYFEEGYDDIYGRRRSRDGESWLKRESSSIFYKILQCSTRVPIQKDTGDFRLLSRRALEALKKYRECRRYTKGFFSLVGFKKKEVLFDRPPRVAGRTKWNYLGLVGLAVEGITSFTSVPLRISTYLGFFAAFAGLAYMIYIIVKTLIYGDPASGYPSMMSVILLLGGVQLVCIGIIGEYLGRVFDETKNRPLYFVDEYNGAKWAGDGSAAERRRGC